MARRFAFVDLAYSSSDNALIAEEGKYLSPVAFEPCVDGLPLLVRHFCLVQATKER